MSTIRKSLAVVTWLAAGLMWLDWLGYLLKLLTGGMQRPLWQAALTLTAGYLIAALLTDLAADLWPAQAGRRTA